MWRWEAEEHLPTDPADDSRAGRGRPRQDAVSNTHSGNVQWDYNSAAVIRAGRISVRSMLSLIVLLVCLANFGARLAKITHLKTTLHHTLNNNYEATKPSFDTQHTPDTFLLRQAKINTQRLLTPKPDNKYIPKPQSRFNKIRNTGAAHQTPRIAATDRLTQPSSTTTSSPNSLHLSSDTTSQLRSQMSANINNAARNQPLVRSLEPQVEMDLRDTLSTRRNREQTPEDYRRFAKRPKQKGTGQNNSTSQMRRFDQLQNFKPPPKIIRDQNNYSTAILAAETDENGQLKGPLQTIRQYADKAAFLKSISMDNVETNHKGDVTVKGLKPGNEHRQMINSTFASPIMSQDSINCLKRQQRRWADRTVYFRIRPREETGIDKSPYSESPNISSTTLPSWQYYQDQNEPWRRSSLKPQIPLKSPLTHHVKPSQLVNADFSSYLASHMWLYARRGVVPVVRVYVKLAKTQIARILTAPICAAVNAENHTKLRNVHSPRTHLNTVSPVTTLGTFRKNVPYITSEIFARITIIIHSRLDGIFSRNKKQKYDTIPKNGLVFCL